MNKHLSLEERAAALAKAFQAIGALVKQDPTLFPQPPGTRWKKLGKGIGAGGTARVNALRDARAALRGERLRTPRLNKRSKPKEPGMDITEPKKRKKKSKTTKLAKAQALAGGLDWRSLTQEQRRRIKDAVRVDRAVAKVAKLGGAATSIADHGDARATGEVEDGQFEALRKVLSTSGDPVAIAKAQAELDRLSREAVRKALRTGQESAWGAGIGVRGIRLP